MSYRAGTQAPDDGIVQKNPIHFPSPTSELPTIVIKADHGQEGTKTNNPNEVVRTNKLSSKCLTPGDNQTLIPTRKVDLQPRIINC